MTYRHDDGICEATGLPVPGKYKDRWTDRSLPDAPFNRCGACAPKDFTPMGKRLADLDRRLAKTAPRQQRP